jgi:hypothetical protein
MLINERKASSLALIYLYGTTLQEQMTLQSIVNKLYAKRGQGKHRA